jgi:hypothetical protein
MPAMGAHLVIDVARESLDALVESLYTQDLQSNFAGTNDDDK